MVEITAGWGKGDAYTTIRLSRSIYRKIQVVTCHERTSYSWYEGKR
jgi:hypothetical protein